MLPPDHPLYKARTLAGLVQTFAQTSPHRQFARLVFAKSEEEVVNYRTLLDRSLQFKNYFENQGMKENDVVVIILEHGADLFYAWLGAVLLGAVPSIVAYPSVKIPLKIYQGTLRLLLEACDTRWVLTSPVLASDLREAVESWPVRFLLSN